MGQLSETPRWLVNHNKHDIIMIFMAYEKSAYKNIYDTYEPQKKPQKAIFILFFHGHVGLPYRANRLPQGD
jgi:hypothetical protein